jgi:nucleotidyltransferase/DNA polymerase involved in DNA repair
MSFASAYFDLDSYFSGVEQERLRAYGVPLVVAETGLDGIVYDASYEARRLGILPGDLAYDLRVRFPKITIVEPDIPAYSDLAERVMNEISSIGVPWRRLSMSEAVLDVRNIRDRLGGDEWAGVRVVERLRRFLRDTHCLSSRSGFSQGYLSAMAACNEASPDSVRSVDVEEYPVWWRAQSCATVPGVHRDAQEVLTRAGVLTLGDAANTGCADLVLLLGDSLGSWLWRSATSETDTPGLPPPGDRDTFLSAGSTFTHNVYTIEQLRQALMPIVASLCSRLVHERQHAGALSVRLRGASGFERSLTAECALGREYSLMYNSAKTLLETLWSDTHGTIRELAVRFEDVRDSDAMPFFDKYSRDINKDLKSGVNVTHSVFGEGAVLSESDTWRYVSFYDKARWVEATCLC